MAEQETFVIATGLVVPDTSATLAEVQSEWQTAFGADLVLDPSTPQGVMISAETTARNTFLDNNAAIANQINPNYAGGVFLDAIIALTGQQRSVATQTYVSGVTVTGVGAPPTTIPQGSQAQTAAGDLFETVQAVTIGASGTATVDFQSVAYGSVPCAANQLTTIVTGVLGWETVNNTVAGVLGSETQTDQQARAYRQNTLAFQAISLAEAVTSSLYAVPGVSSLTFRENVYPNPAGMLIYISGGTTLSGQVWGLTTTGYITVDTTGMAFAQSAQSLPLLNPWPIAAYATTANVTLSALTTQAGGDWSMALTAGNIILAAHQTTTQQNGLYVAAAGAWTRQSYNPSGAQILGSIDGISMTANSVYACVDGGNQTAVAAALLENKSSGSGWNGSNVVPLVEPASGQTYQVAFDTPTQIGILIKVTVSGASSAQVIQAILDYQAGSVTSPSGQPANLAGFVVGADVSPFDLSAAISIENPGAYVSSVQISLYSPISYQTTPIAIGLNQIAVTYASYITVTVV